MSSSVLESGSVRIDLLGGTLDLWPINLILEDTVTLNLATSLQAKVSISQSDLDNGLTLISKDYNSTLSFKDEENLNEKISAGFYKEWTFVLKIIQYFKSINSGLIIELESGSPPGAGLGGSSAMGITLYKALSSFLKKEFDKKLALKVVSEIEAIILNSGPTGYQDYYPALFGGILALRPKLTGVEVTQLYSSDLSNFIQDNITLVYTGEKRLSGINNWEVYKRFFDGDEVVIKGLREICKLSNLAFHEIKNKNYQNFLEAIKEEGKLRQTLFSGIVTPSMEKLFNILTLKNKNIGMKVCGAGGGGCFLLIHQKNDRILVEEEVKKLKMTILDFQIQGPI